MPEQQASKRVGDWEEGKREGELGREGKTPLPIPFHALFLPPFPPLFAPATQVNCIYMVLQILSPKVDYE